jgi:hypothetical protein
MASRDAGGDRLFVTGKLWPKLFGSNRAGGRDERQAEVAKGSPFATSDQPALRVLQCWRAWRVRPSVEFGGYVLGRVGGLTFFSIAMIFPSLPM